MSKKIALILAINFYFYAGFSAVHAQSAEETTAITAESADFEKEQLPVTELVVPEQEAAQNETVQKETEQKNIAKEDKYKDLPKSGVLSGTYSLGGDSKNVSGPWGSEEAVANTSSPITGSVSKISAKQWKAVVFNNSEDDFSVSVKVRQIDSKSNSVKSDSFSLRLKAKSSDQRLISSATSAISAELELISWKKL